MVLKRGGKQLIAKTIDFVRRARRGARAVVFVCVHAAMVRAYKFARCDVVFQQHFARVGVLSAINDAHVCESVR
jgi:hypothetical protein